MPGGGAGGTWFAIFVSRRMKTKAAAKIAIFFIKDTQSREAVLAHPIPSAQRDGPTAALLDVLGYPPLM